MRKRYWGGRPPDRPTALALIVKAPGLVYSGPCLYYGAMGVFPAVDNSIFVYDGLDTSGPLVDAWAFQPANNGQVVKKVTRPVRASTGLYVTLAEYDHTVGIFVSPDDREYWR